MISSVLCLPDNSNHSIAHINIACNAHLIDADYSLMASCKTHGQSCSEVGTCRVEDVCDSMVGPRATAHLEVQPGAIANCSEW